MEMLVVLMPMAVPRWLAGKAATRIAGPEACRAASARLCNPRAAINSGSVGASAASTPPAPRMMMPVRATRLRPIRSATRPAGSSSALKPSRRISATHCTAGRSALKSRAIVGNATSAPPTSIPANIMLPAMTAATCHL